MKDTTMLGTDLTALLTSSLCLLLPFVGGAFIGAQAKGYNEGRIGPRQAWIAIVAVITLSLFIGLFNITSMISKIPIYPFVAGLLLAGVITFFARPPRDIYSKWFTGIALASSASVSILSWGINGTVGYSDIALMTSFGAAGMLAGIHRNVVVTKRVALIGVSAIISFLGVEVATRVILPPAPRFPAAGDAHFVVPEQSYPWNWGPMYSDWAHHWLYPELNPDAKNAMTRFSANSEYKVLHIGDSMVQGASIRKEGLFTTLLDNDSPETIHLNGGVPGVGIDYYYLLVKAWTRNIDIDLVVMHIFVGNDIMELNMPYAFCNDGPLLSCQDSSIVENCPQPVMGPSRKAPLFFHMTPYPFRVLTHYSSFARHLCALIHRISERPTLQWSATPEVLTLILKSTRDYLSSRKIGLIVTLLPYRSKLEHKVTKKGDIPKDHMELLEINQKLGIHTIDMWPLFQTLVSRDGSKQYFLNRPPGDVHFNIKGHQHVAQLLADRLAEEFDSRVSQPLLQ